MQILDLEAHNIRNFKRFCVKPAANFNILYGENGSGKTSFLEAIYFLGLGRSFRSHLSKRIIREDQEKLSVFAKLENQVNQEIPLGVEKTIKGETRIRLAGDNASIVEAAALMPLQLLNNDSFSLITEGPKPRRQFLDWGLFHVKHQFIDCWRRFQHALKQRNAAIKQKSTLGQITSWNNTFIKAALAITKMRQEYVQAFCPLFAEILQQLLPFTEIEFKFRQGWSIEDDFKELLERNLNKDSELGYTFYGPQRADLKITEKNIPVQDVLSRGQQKILVWAMKLAQGILLRKLIDKNCIYLIDDLPSELDSTRRQAISDLLISIKSQVFVTGIEAEPMRQFLDVSSSKMFHVKHGDVIPV